MGRRKGEGGRERALIAVLTEHDSSFRRYFATLSHVLGWRFVLPCWPSMLVNWSGKVCKRVAGGGSIS